MKLTQYLEKAIFHTGTKKPTSLRDKTRVVFRTYTESCGVKFVSKISLGINADAINWTNTPFNKIYDWAEVTPNVLIEQARTVKI